jgi:hypothetical protein
MGTKRKIKKIMSEENTKPENVVEFKEPEPEFGLNFPPLPHSPNVAYCVKKWSKFSPVKQQKLIDKLQAFFSEVFYTGGAGEPQPSMPTTLKNMGPELLSFVQLCIDRRWKEYHFNRGFNSRPEDERKQIAEDIRVAKEAAEFYSHLPVDGAEIALPDGTKKHFDLVTLKQMVDKGMIPPNPDAKKVDVKPFLAVPAKGEGIIS